ncbi:hypothetical protein ERO13_A03G026600v2 [Gossypium hirsutum]|uniref:Disease resistance protein RGA4 n=1 Tax=Gossypium hirsutum TaxID=3635 RepID=A0A1U8PZR2_GOSHI|nr:putative disease resistance protein RGA4 [Gossypium hirsutum]KAG4206749.1 hypothetical protein ERO13_A03G026600v2 [Gossypium hirsutum]
MAEAFAAEVAANVLAKLSSAAFQQIGCFWDVQDEFEKLRDVLMAIKAVLVDAEEQQNHNREITLWLQKFKDGCYRVEDLLDEFEIEALRRQVMERGSSRRKVSRFLSGSNSLTFRLRMGRKIKKVKDMLDEIESNKSRFHLLERHHRVRNIIHGQRETYSFVKTSDVIGRDEDKENMVAFLMNPTDGDGEGDDIPVLAIVGIGGIGKTALAQLVFNDERVKTHFWLRIWVCVTEDFDVKQLMIKIIKSATGTTMCKDMNKEELHKVLRDGLKAKRFLIVLDDVWNEDKRKWIELKDLLTIGGQGCKIICTTRSHKVAAITSTVPQYDLEHLSYENSLSLFLRLAFKEGEEVQHKNLVRIGEGIVRKCKGVALAVKTLGSLLCSTRVEYDWELVRDSEIWKLEQKENDILPALKLSYDHLPWHLKQCFAFCSVFPKDFEFNSLQLTLLWMATGFLQSSNENEEPEDIGNRYIHELWSRSFFQQVEEGVFYSTFKMHDLVHDLALSVVQNEVNSFNHCSTGNVRHLWLDASGQGASTLPNNLDRLQSLIISSHEEQKASSESLIADYISRSKHLRVLHLVDSSFEQLPNSIGYLKHLRYLSIYGNGNIERLPISICNLQSLQTLLLGGCRGIEALPKDIRYLISLRTLCITTKQANLQESGIGCLSSLRFLRFYACGNLKYLFEDMQRLTALRILVIDECKNLVSLPPGLKYLTALQILVISECEKLDLCMGQELEGEQAGSLQKLFIRGLPKVVSLPQWILLGSAKTLQQLYIIGLENLSTLPRWFRYLVSLQTLRIVDCPKLLSLPQGMQQLAALKQVGITGCPKLGKRCMKQTGEEWPKIAHVPQLYVSNDLETSITYDE